MTLFKLKRYCNYVTETLKKSDLTGVRALSCQAVLVKQNSEKRRKTLFEGSNRVFQYSYCHKRGQVWDFLEKELKIPKFKIHSQLLKMSARNNRSVAEIKAVIDFLRSKGYKSPVIAESIQICFYTIENIQKGLQMILENEEKLARMGIFEGFSKNKENRFTHGSSVKNKKLQLCLYYMELPYDFTGHGSFD